MSEERPPAGGLNWVLNLAFALGVLVAVLCLVVDSQHQITNAYHAGFERGRDYQLCKLARDTGRTLPFAEAAKCVKILEQSREEI